MPSKPARRRTGGRRLGLALAVMTLFAAPQARAAASVPMTGTERLAAFMPDPGPADIRGQRGEASFYFNLSTRIDPAQVRLHLEGTNSAALLARRSQLVVRLNGVVVAQIALDPAAPVLVADIDIPAELLRGGGNRLTLASAQHYTNDCEEPDAPELWTQIDTARSRLTIAGRTATQPPHLSELQELISPAMFGGRRFTLLSATAPDRLDATELAVGAELAQALGLRLRYKPAEIALAQARPAPAGPADPLGLALPTGVEAADYLLFGTRDRLKPYLGAAVAEAVTGGFLGIYRLPADPRSLVLVVSGVTDADLARAAKALTIANIGFVDAPSQTIDRLEIAPEANFFPRRDLREGTTTRFADLGFATTTMTGRDSLATLEVVMPPDLYAPDTAEVEMLLDFAYGAGLRADSVVNVMLNGQLQQAIALNNPNGAVLRGYRIRVPLAKFRPGPNSLQFRVAMLPTAAGACVPMQSGNLLFAFQDTSSIAIPGGEHITLQPDLRLFATTGFPYSGAGGVGMTLGARDAATIGAGWTLLARLAQAGGGALADLQIGFDPQPAGRNLLVVGASADLDLSQIATAPVGLLPSASFPYASATPRPPADKPWLRWLADALGLATHVGAAQAGDHADPQGISRIGGSGDIGRNGLLMAARAPLAAERTVTVLTASSREALWQAAQEVVQPAVWYRLAQDMTVWRSQSDSVQTQRVGPTFYVGNRSTVYAVRYFLAEYPASWAAVIAGATLLFALVLRRAILRRRRLRLPGTVEGIP